MRANYLLLIFLSIATLVACNSNVKSESNFIKVAYAEELQPEEKLLETPKKSKRDSIVALSYKLVGTPYKTASCSENGFDCSGFVYYIFKSFDVSVPRSSIGYKNFGKEISLEKVQKGDVLLFKSPTRNVIGHVGIVSNADGNNSDFLHSTSGKAMAVVETSLSSKYYTKRFVKAVRVIN